VKYAFHYDPPAVADEGSEFEIQVRLRNRVKMVAPRIRLVATPNGGKRSQWEAMRAKAEGMSAGFVDLQAIWPGGIAFLEMKARSGTLSEAQIDWLNWLHNAGFPCGCFRSVESAVEFLRRAGAPVWEQAA
jgi:hypothetical protein